MESTRHASATPHEPETAPGPAGTLVLSPHADDAALSLGGILQQGILPLPVTLATVFGRSNFSQIHGFGDWREITPLRRSEDESYARSLGLSWRDLDLPEAALRDDPRPGDRIFARGPSRQIPEPSDLRPELGRLLDELHPASLWLPLGLGCHEDHLLTVRAATALACGRKIPRVYYEDLPYAASLTDGAVRRQAAGIDPGLHPFFFPVQEVFDRKMEALGFYRSQLLDTHLDAVRRHGRRWARAEARERVWSLTLPRTRTRG